MAAAHSVSGAQQCSIDDGRQRRPRCGAARSFYLLGAGAPARSLPARFATPFNPPETGSTAGGNKQERALAVRRNCWQQTLSAADSLLGEARGVVMKTSRRSGAKAPDAPVVNEYEEGLKSVLKQVQIAKGRQCDTGAYSV